MESIFIGGIPPAAYRPPGAPAHWMAYFQVDDVDSCASKAKGLGAKLCLAPMTMEGVGRLAVIADPQARCSRSSSRRGSQESRP